MAASGLAPTPPFFSDLEQKERGDMKGMKRKDARNPNLAPTGEEWRKMEAGIEGGTFSSGMERKYARFVVRGISRYDAGTAWINL